MFRRLFHELPVVRLLFSSSVLALFAVSCCCSFCFLRRLRFRLCTQNSITKMMKRKTETHETTSIQTERAFSVSTFCCMMAEHSLYSSYVRLLNCTLAQSSAMIRESVQLKNAGFILIWRSFTQAFNVWHSQSPLLNLIVFLERSSAFSEQNGAKSSVSTEVIEFSDTLKVARVGWRPIYGILVSLFLVNCSTLMGEVTSTLNTESLSLLWPR